MLPFIRDCKPSLTPTRLEREVHPPAGQGRPREPLQSAVWSPACPHSWTGCWSTTCLRSYKQRTQDITVSSYSRQCALMSQFHRLYEVGMEAKNEANAKCLNLAFYTMASRGWVLFGFMVSIITFNTSFSTIKGQVCFKRSLSLLHSSTLLLNMVPLRCTQPKCQSQGFKTVVCKPMGDITLIASTSILQITVYFWLTHGWGQCRDRWEWRVCCPWECLSLSHEELHG